MDKVIEAHRQCKSEDLFILKILSFETAIDGSSSQILNRAKAASVHLWVAKIDGKAEAYLSCHFVNCWDKQASNQAGFNACGLGACTLKGQRCGCMIAPERQRGGLGALLHGAAWVGLFEGIAGESPTAHPNTSLPPNEAHPHSAPAPFSPCCWFEGMERSYTIEILVFGLQITESWNPASI